MYTDKEMKNILKNAVCYSLSSLSIDFERKDVYSECYYDVCNNCYKMKFEFKKFKHSFYINSKEIDEKKSKSVYKMIIIKCHSFIKSKNIIDCENNVAEIDILTYKIKKYLSYRLNACIEVKFIDECFEKKIIINAYFDRYNRLVHYIKWDIIAQLINMISKGKLIDKNLEMLLENIIKKFENIFLEGNFYKK